MDTTKGLGRVSRGSRVSIVGDDMNRERRIEHANALVGCIASCGRRFLDGDPVARIYCDNRGHPWFVDGYTQKHIYLYYPRWGGQQGFSQGGTLRELVNQLKEWIIGNRAFVSRGVFQHWGYGADMQIVLDEAVRLGILGDDSGN